MDGVITLMTSVVTRDKYGVEGETFTPRDVFCKVDSITRAEFYQAGRNGLNPEFKFTIFAEDYQGERVCKYNDASYAIYRTYRTDNDYMELYVQREGGTNGKGNS